MTTHNNILCILTYLDQAKHQKCKCPTGHLKTFSWRIAHANLTLPFLKVLPLSKQETKFTTCYVPLCCFLGMIAQTQSAKFKFLRSWSRRSIWRRAEIENISFKPDLLFDTRRDFRILINWPDLYESRITQWAALSAFVCTWSYTRLRSDTLIYQ